MVRNRSDEITKFGSLFEGNKPDFHNAMGTEKAEAMYDLFVKKMRESYKPELVKGNSSSNS